MFHQRLSSQNYRTSSAPAGALNFACALICGATNAAGNYINLRVPGSNPGGFGDKAVAQWQSIMIVSSITCRRAIIERRSKLMDIQSLQKHFGRIGARVKIAEAGASLGRRQFINIDIGADAKGEYFDIKRDPLENGDLFVVNVEKR
jgi:hypothetical protein